TRLRDNFSLVQLYSFALVFLLCIFLYDLDKRQFYRDLEWGEYISQDWEPDKIRSMMGNLRHFRLQSSLEQTDYKLSYFTDGEEDAGDRKSTRLNSSHVKISY